MLYLVLVIFDAFLSAFYSKHSQVYCEETISENMNITNNNEKLVFPKRGGAYDRWSYLFQLRSKVTEPTAID